jgi:site-specific DNA recombinase
MIKAVGYIRVSTDEQSASGHSLGAQREKLTAYAALYEIELVEIIEDAGESAKSLNRPGLQRALQMLKSKQVDGLLIAKLDRLTRSVSDWQTLIDGFFGEKAGKSLFSVADSIDTRSSAGRLVLNVLLSVAQWEREAIGERTKDALHHKKQKNERTGGIPFGKTLSDDGSTLIDNREELVSLSLMKQLRGEGQTLREIAKELEIRGVKNKAGRSRWIHSQVQKLLEKHAV